MQGSRDGSRPLIGCNDHPTNSLLLSKLKDKLPSSSTESHAEVGQEARVVTECSRKRHLSGTSGVNSKKAKTITSSDRVGYDNFPDDKFLFETSNGTVEDADETVRMDASECVPIMETISSWEELDERERNMDCKQLLMFRQAYLSSRGSKPKFVGKSEQWSSQPRVFKQHMTVSLLYLALLYTEQPVLPADIVRYQ